MKTTDSTQKIHPETIEFFTNATWEFTRKNLYGGFHFPEVETIVAKHHIRNYYRDILPDLFQDHAGEYMQQFCDRVLLAREYILSRPGRFIPNPSMWLNPDNERGFAGTKKWLKEKRSETPTMKFFYMNKQVFMVESLSDFLNRILA